MDKPRCFVIMPISDQIEYEIGHFSRVYNHLIKPAIELAGFVPVRADDVKESDVILIDILNNIHTCDMAICDLSSKNANVLYELGIRHSFNLPVVLMKDEKTGRVFDIQGIRCNDYNSNLRIDEVKMSIEKISAALKDTYEMGSSKPNSILKLLEVEPAQINDKIKIGEDTQIILNALKTVESRMRSVESKIYETKNIYSLDDFDYSHYEAIYKPGDKVKHHSFGYGTIVALNGPVLRVAFQTRGIKNLALKACHKVLVLVDEIPTDDKLE